MNYFYIKKFLDISLAFILFVILIPIFFIISILIIVDSKGSVFFLQKRVGYNKKIYKIFKFRTMKNTAPKDVATHLFNDSEIYITRIGRFLRKTSLDELPQLINIFKGQMSFVGPRPALWNQFDLIQERDIFNIHSILPGLTGYAQINGRDSLDIIQKVLLDKFYLNNLSLFLDLKIIFLTIFYVFYSKDVLEGGTKNKKDGLN